jgi:hypothetical protein
MNLQLLPLLHVQRDLYAMPRDMARFHEYLKTMKGASADDIELAPLMLMNPMGKEHCLAAVERLIAIGAEDLAAQALAEAESRLQDAPGHFKVSLVLADDRMGGWTSRTLAFAGATTVALPADELAYAREVIAPHLDAADQPTVFACLFGDEAASEAGYPQLGLPRNAAIEVALVDHLRRSRPSPTWP